MSTSSTDGSYVPWQLVPHEPREGSPPVRRGLAWAAVSSTVIGNLAVSAAAFAAVGAIAMGAADPDPDSPTVVEPTTQASVGETTSPPSLSTSPASVPVSPSSEPATVTVSEPTEADAEQPAPATPAVETSEEAPDSAVTTLLSTPAPDTTTAVDTVGSTLTEPVSRLGDCPSGGGWTGASADLVEPDADQGTFRDQNGDGWLCFKNTSAEPDAPRVWEDNTVKPGKGTWNLRESR